FLEFHPLAAKPDESDTVEFRIPNTGKFYINPSAIFFYVKAKIVHANGGSLSHRSRRQAKVEGSTAQSASATTQSGSTTQNTTQSSSTSGSGTQGNDVVVPVDNFINSMFQHIDVYLNQKLVTRHEYYAYQSFIDLVLRSN